jgi:signal transduction histidine kinase
VGLPSTASTDPPNAGRRSIRSANSATVVVPAVCLLLAWAVVAAVTLGTALAGWGYFAKHRGIADLIVGGAGLAVVLAVVVQAASFARRLSSDAMSLAATAKRLASQQAAQPAGRVSADSDGAQSRPRPQTTEMAQAEAAIISLQQTATAAAASEAALRRGLREVFVSLARRNQSLLQRQLRLIDALEQKAADPAALADLFSLDHLTTRMRRHAESLAIVSGAAPGRTWREPIPVIDVIRGAMAEVEDYKRVSILTSSEDAITGPAVADMIHLIAELIENATLFSPSGTMVEVRAGRVANGFAVEVDDRGLGVEPDQLSEINRQLASPPDFDLANSDQLGLFVGGKLAARHGVRVSLQASPYGGTTAIVLMPGSIVVPAPGSPPEADLPKASAPDARPADQLASAGAAAVPEGRPPGARVPGSGLPARRAVRRSPSPSPSPSAAGPAPATAESADASGAHPAAAVPAPRDASLASPALPRRSRQSGLSADLLGKSRDDPPSAGQPAAPEPDHARNLAASLQSGWLRGRQEDPPDENAAGRPDAATGRTEPEVAQNEDANE